MTRTTRGKLSAVALGASIGGAIGFAVCAPSCQTTVDPRTMLKHLEVQGATPNLRARRWQVEKELKRSNLPEWAGSYAWSNGFQRHRLELSPVGFAYEYSHCTGTGDLAYGTVGSVDGSLVRLVPQQRVTVELDRSPDPNRREQFQFENELYLIAWGEERFLVPTSAMEEFCRLAKATRFDSMTYASYPRRVREGEPPIGNPELEGLPDVPAQFRHLLPR